MHPTTRTGRRRSAAPQPIRQVARAAHLTLRKLAEAVVRGQPSPPEPAEHTALLRWLAQSAANANPDICEGELAEHVAARLREMAKAGDETAKAVMEAPAMEFCVNLARIEIALAGSPWAPDRPAVPKQQRIDSIAATVLQLTGWTSVDSETTGAIYRWLFGDEALFVAGTKMRVEAGRRMFDNQDPSPVRVPHPYTGELVLVTREKVLEHAGADGRVLAAGVRYEERQARWHGRLIRALRPYGDDSTSVGEALERAARDLGIARDERSFEEFAGLVVATAEARDGAARG